MASETDVRSAKEEKPKSSALIWIIVAVANLVLVGGGAFFVFKRAPEAEEAPESAAASAQETGPMLELDPFIANLNEPDGNRYLKVTLSVEMADVPALQEADKQVIKLRDTVLLFLSSLGVADTQGAEGKEEIRKALLARARRILGKKTVRGIFYSEFVLQ